MEILLHFGLALLLLIGFILITVFILNIVGKKLILKIEISNIQKSIVGVLFYENSWLDLLSIFVDEVYIYTNMKRKYHDFINISVSDTLTTIKINTLFINVNKFVSWKYISNSEDIRKRDIKTDQEYKPIISKTGHILEICYQKNPLLYAKHRIKK